MKHLINLFLLTSVISLFGQGQIELSRISQMPDLPSPYLMRDWKVVAQEYDTLLFSRTASGEYTPLLRIGSSGVNYPEIAPIFLDSYVGSSSHGQQREAINIIPAIVGASLVGIDKTTQYSIDWVSKIKDFYNLKNGENVYLNGPSSSSGHDWWYETMPNIFFYQLYDLYPNARDSDFEAQFVTVADRWLDAVIAMGGSATPWSVPEMNHRSWDLSEMKPGPAGVLEPEAAGAIAWILYQAYVKTGSKKYLTGAQLSLDFLDELSSNPSYELQLPYGVMVAAKLNAESHSNYDLEKMLNWCFNRGNLRSWGSAVGTWSGYDVSGLIGEANDQGNDYVFLMNGFQQAAALAPLVKYDKRYSKAIAKWILNVANASRLFYSGYLPESRQSDYQWASVNDPGSVIAYEAIKENWQGNGIYARGDSKDAGWAATNLGIYGSSHVGYLGAIVRKTNVDGVLLIDTDTTDFFARTPFHTCLVYNPHGTAKTINLSVGAESKDIYDAITEQFLARGVSGTASIDLPATEVRLISYIPAGSLTSEKDGRLMVGEAVLDYHYGYDYTPKLRIKSLAASGDSLEVNQPANVFVTLNGNWDATYEWYLNDQIQSSNGPDFGWKPETKGSVEIRVKVTSQGQVATDSIQLKVVDLIPQIPVIDTFYVENRWVAPGESVLVQAEVQDPRDLPLTLSWDVENGEITEESGSSIKVTAGAPGILKVSLRASNYALESLQSISVLIIDQNSDSDPLVYLPLDGVSTDQSGNKFETKIIGGKYVDDSEGTGQHAFQVSTASDEVRITNAQSLNFGDQISISFWAKFSDFVEERFIISHGSWESRWKVSTTTDRKLRWTVNTSDGIKDLDASIVLMSGVWYHFTVVYSGTSMQIYLNGELDVFTAHTGLINSSDIDICVGKRLPGDSRYFLKGAVDEVKIFSTAISPGKIKTMPMQRWDPLGSTTFQTDGIHIYPNPVSRSLFISGTASSEIRMFDLAGSRIVGVAVYTNQSGLIQVDLPHLTSGVYILVVGQSHHKLMIK